ncbi:MAG: GNAT family N-acetyltransferase [Actinomycetota bacterium]
MKYDIRPVSEAEISRFVDVAGTAFGDEHSEESVNRFRSKTELDRTVAAFDDGDIVGTNSSYAFEMTVPGGELSAAGVTIVGVLPTHRRKGILRAMMRYQLEDVHRRGEPLAVLYASESNIYQRFGYGPAARMTWINLLKERTAFLDPSPAVGRTRLLSLEDSLRSLPPIYDRVRAVTPGMYRRSETWWKVHTLSDPKEHREGYSPQYRAVWEHEGGAHAYAAYRWKNSWNEEAGYPDGHVWVNELIGTSPLALREMWRYVFGIDLVTSIRAGRLPMDDPLFFMLAEPRRLSTFVDDGMWLRVVDVVGALEGRTYAEDGSLSFALRDDFCPWNEGRYALEVKSGKGRVTEAAGDVDLELSVRELAAGYLGGTPFTALKGAGRVVESRPGAVRRADRLFYSEVTPRCPEEF